MPRHAAGHHQRAASYDADFLVVALGADYDFAATPGLPAGHDEFYSVEGACNRCERLPAARW